MGPLFTLLCWRDLIEIAFFIAAFYRVSCWLARDRSSDLLPHFYGYCVGFIIAYMAGLELISSLLLLSAPVAALLFILVHRETLQKNFITHKRVVQEASNTGWVEALVSASLAAASDDKDTLCVMECSDSLKQFLFAQTAIGASVDRGLLQVLLASPSYDASRMVWVDSDGRLVALNVCHLQSKLAEDTAAVSCKGDIVCEWRENSIALSRKTDALFFRFDAQARRFQVIAGGIVQNDLEMTHALHAVKEHMAVTIEDGKKEGVGYGTTKTGKRAQQDLS